MHFIILVLAVIFWLSVTQIFVCLLMFNLIEVDATLSPFLTSSYISCMYVLMINIILWHVFVIIVNISWGDTLHISECPTTNVTPTVNGYVLICCYIPFYNSHKFYFSLCYILKVNCYFYLTYLFFVLFSDIFIHSCFLYILCFLFNKWILPSLISFL